jgi:hypothetical protein
MACGRRSCRCRGVLVLRLSSGNNRAGELITRRRSILPGHCSLHRVVAHEDNRLTEVCGALISEVPLHPCEQWLLVVDRCPVDG